MEARRGIRAEVEYDVRLVDPFENQGGVAAQVRKGTISEKQLGYLVKMGMSATTASTWSKQQAGIIITKRRVHFDVLLKSGWRWSQIKALSLAEGDREVKRVQGKKNGIVQQGHPGRQPDARSRDPQHGGRDSGGELRSGNQPQVQGQPDW